MTNTVDVKKTKKKKKAASLEKKKARAGWIFVLPFVIGFVIIYFPIVFESIRASLFYTTKVDGKFVDTFNYFNSYYQAFFHEDTGDFLQTLFSGIGEIVLDIPMILLFSLFMAVLLNQKMAGRAVFRAIFFVPVILSTGIMDAIDASAVIDTMTDADGIDDGSGGSASGQVVDALDMQRLFNGIAVTDGMLGYVTNTINDIFNIVNRSGVQMLIFLAGLQSISPAIYESVQIDGASAWETFWKITFPMISPMILVNAVYTVIDSFTSENAVMDYINSIKTAIPEMGSAISAAMSWIYFILVIAVLGVVVAILSAYTFYQRKK
jgi:ABC-type sugar transport system permease subunit